MASWLSNLPCPDERYLHSNMHGLWPHTHLLRKFPDTFFEMFWPHTSHPNVHRFHQPHVSPVSRFSPKHIQAQRLSNSFLVQPKERYLISFIYSNVDRLWPYASAQNTVTTRGFYSPITLFPHYAWQSTGNLPPTSFSYNIPQTGTTHDAIVHAASLNSPALCRTAPAHISKAAAVASSVPPDVGP